MFIKEKKSKKSLSLYSLLLVSSLFIVCALFNGRITFTSIRNLPIIRYAVIRCLSLNNITVSHFTVNGEESAVDCSSDPSGKEIYSGNGCIFLLGK